MFTRIVFLTVVVVVVVVHCVAAGVPEGPHHKQKYTPVYVITTLYYFRNLQIHSLYPVETKRKKKKY